MVSLACVSKSLMVCSQYQSDIQGRSGARVSSTRRQKILMVPPQLRENLDRQKTSSLHVVRLVTLVVWAWMPYTTILVFLFAFFCYLEPNFGSPSSAPEDICIPPLDTPLIQGERQHLLGCFLAALLHGWKFRVNVNLQMNLVWFGQCICKFPHCEHRPITILHPWLAQWARLSTSFSYLGQVVCSNSGCR